MSLRTLPLPIASYMQSARGSLVVVVSGRTVHALSALEVGAPLHLTNEDAMATRTQSQVHTVQFGVSSVQVLCVTAARERK